jgi:MerR family redox-sensitive transcriptional activator SoxR
MSQRSTQPNTISIGELSKRTGLAITAIRYYEQEHLITSARNAGGQRRFKRSDIRRLSFVKISQNLGFSLSEIQQVLAGLPQERTPTKRDWEQLSKHFASEIDKRIEGLISLRENLSGCIGCGCLSLKSCALYNPSDAAATLGSGPRYLMGNSSKDVK